MKSILILSCSVHVQKDPQAKLNQWLFTLKLPSQVSESYKLSSDLHRDGKSTRIYFSQVKILLL